MIENGDKGVIKKFSCNNFRNISTEDLTFEKINILIGPNNSGKSNFIKALTFYSEMIQKAEQGNLKTAFLNAVARNGWEHALNKYAGEHEIIDFLWDMILDGELLRYRFSYAVGKELKDYNIVREEVSAAATADTTDSLVPFNYFSCHTKKPGYGEFSSAVKKGKKNHRIGFSVDSQEILAMQFKDILLDNKSLYSADYVRVDIAQFLNDLNNFFENFSMYSSAQFDTKKMREHAPAKNADILLNADAGNFVSVFSRYKSEDVLWTQVFTEKMQQLMPQLKMMDVANAYDKLIFKLVIENKEYDLSDVSEGTLKALILNMLINPPESKRHSLLAIDEPETNLHPAWQKVIGNWIQTSHTYEQCFVSTHSPDFMDVFTDEFKQGKVAVFVFDGGASQSIKKIKYEDIAAELGEWELGDLYRTSDPALGGWPW